MPISVNIAAALERQASERPQQVALSSPDGVGIHEGARGYRQWSFQKLWQRIARLAFAMTERGVTRGMRTVLMVPPSLEFVETTFALFHLGAVPVFVDPGMGLVNLKACLQEAEPTAFIGVPKAHLARVLLGWAQKSLRIRLSVGGPAWWTGAGTLRLPNSWATCLPAVTNTPVEMQANDPAAILFTSGSTGVPKGAVYTHGMFTAQLEMLQRAFAIEPGEVDLCTFPLFALFGPALGMTSIVPVMDATKPALVEPDEIVLPIRRFQATNLFGSPALLNCVGRALADGESGAIRNECTPSLKRVLSAGAPVSPAILERFRRLLAPGVQIFTPYGATEALPVAVVGSDDVLNETRHKTAQGAGTCVGRPVAGIEVRIIRIKDEPIAEWSDDLALPAGEIGEIAVSGPQVTQEYFRRPDLTALAKISDAVRGQKWHRMGDVGYFDEQGRLWFCGRKSQRVITPERTYFTDLVEGVFNAHPAVFRSALVGVPRNGAMTPVLCVELEKTAKPPATAAITRELLELGRQHDHTRVITTVLYHPAFPVDIRHNSKIFREKLAVWASRQMPRPSA